MVRVGRGTSEGGLRMVRGTSEGRGRMGWRTSGESSHAKIMVKLSVISL